MLPLKATSVQVHWEESLRAGIHCGCHFWLHNGPQKRKGASHGQELYMDSCPRPAKCKGGVCLVAASPL